MLNLHVLCMYRNGIYSHIVNMTYNTHNIVIWIIKHTWYISYEK